MTRAMMILIFMTAIFLVLSACTPILVSEVEQPVPETGSTLPPQPTPRQPFAVEPAEPPPAGAQAEFRTDFSIHNIPYDEVLSGGPPKDGIPAIDNPAYESISSADAWLEDIEPVIAVVVDDTPRAYPIQVLMWHEIINDNLAGKPLAVTFCPLCNTAIAFERELGGQVYDFGTTGRLRYSNLIMYDRQTETWWQQATGEAIAGELTGSALTFYPAAMISWADFKSGYPQGDVLSRETGLNRPYGQNPYSGYDDVNNPPFLYDGPATPGVLSPLDRVLTLEIGSQAVAYPYDALEALVAVNDEVGGQPVVVFWTAGTSSALDRPSIAGGRDVGAAVAYSRLLDGQTLEFALQEGLITDRQTGSTWDIFGNAIDGELAGSALQPLPAVNHFWFSWAAFKPETRVFSQAE